MKKTKEWEVTFNPETREGYLHCPVCKSVFRYDILNTMKVCPECKTVMSSDNKKEG